MMMMAVVEMRRHFLLRILSRWESVNQDLRVWAAIFSMMNIDFLDAEGRKS